MDRRRFVLSATAVASGASLVAVGNGVAHADDTPRKLAEDPSAIMAKVPRRRIATRSDHTFAQPRGSVVTVGSKDAARDGRRNVGMSFGAGYRFAHERDGYQVFRSTRKGESSVRYVRPTVTGAQAVYVASRPSDLNDMRVEFLSGIRHKVRSGDAWLITLNSGVRLALFDGWAYDSNGQELATTYQFDKDGLVQTVQTTPTTVFPVIADPEWSYTKDYDIGSTLSWEARNKLLDCFNCTFPVDGAPADFPVSGQLLPLTVPFYSVPGVGDISANFHCTFDRWWEGVDQGLSVFGFRFYATENHVDGEGSAISFTMSSYNGVTSLGVYASIINDPPRFEYLGATVYIPRFIYEDGADRMWQQFASNLRT